MKTSERKMRWIGLTGGIATGKSTVSGLFLGRGIPVIDADEIARRVVRKSSPGLQRVVQAFGPEVLGLDQELDRMKMGNLVFGRPEKLQLLESIIHPLVQEEVRRERQRLELEAVHSFAIYDVPLLYEKNLENQFDGVIVVGCSDQIQLDRLMARNHLSLEQAKLRIKSQMPLEKKKFMATWYLDNSGSLSDLQKQFDDLLMKIQSGKQ